MMYGRLIKKSLDQNNIANPNAWYNPAKMRNPALERMLKYWILLLQ